MELQVYNQQGEETGKIKLPAAVFGFPWNADLVHQVLVSMRANQRKNIAHTKNRGEVRGGGKKPWRQKGTGRARHGSIRSPLWRGGGVTFGPRNEKNYSKKINDKMKRKAFLTVLSQKARDNEILALDNLSVVSSKTKEAAGIVKNLAQIKGFEKLKQTKKRNISLILLSDSDKTMSRVFKNLPCVDVAVAPNVSLIDVSVHKYLILPQNLIDRSEKIWK